jgi:hypothetical protein
LSEERDPEAERKFQVWNATTTGLLLEANARMGPQAEKNQSEEKEWFIAKIFETIGPFLRARGDHVQQLGRIIDDALALDREISRQVARVEWVFPNSGTEKLMFDPETMKLEKGEKASKDNQNVLLVVAPGMKKRGKSTGDDFKDESLLIPMEVTCEPVRGNARSKTH